MMQVKPQHEDIEKYGYFLQYCPSRDNWYASYDAEKYTAWYKWNEKQQSFDLLLNYSNVPNDLIIRGN